LVSMRDASASVKAFGFSGPWGVSSGLSIISVPPKKTT
jgi:hypothetical protein